MGPPSLNHKVLNSANNCVSSKENPELQRRPSVIFAYISACEILRRELSHIMPRLLTYEQNYEELWTSEWALFEAINYEVICYLALKNEYSYFGAHD